MINYGKWHDKSEPLPEGDYLLAILTNDGKYVLRPRGWMHRGEGELRTVGRYGAGYAVEKYAILPFVENVEAVMEGKDD